jgi:cardiolipin synthase
VIDGRIGWTGGFGIDDKWLGDGHTNGSWRETNVRIEGPAVRQLQAAFAASWAEATGVLFSGRVAGDARKDFGSSAGLLYATPTIGSTSAERFLAMSIAGARKSLLITNPYFIPDDNLIAILLNAASRGVDVRILTAGPRTDVDVVRQAGRSRYEKLMEAGIHIYEWQPSTLHAKTFVVDGRWSTIGSMNLDNRSLVLNDEATLMMLDEAIGQQMQSIFFDDLQHAQEINLAQFRRRGWRARVAEAIARVIAPVL